MRTLEPLALKAAALVRDEMELFVTTLSPSYFDHDTLQGACGISSRVLHRVFKRLGIQNDFVMGQYLKSPHLQEGKDNHCWVEVPRLGVVVDITATQFGVPSPVHVTVPGDPYQATSRNGTATRRLADWDGQSHTWYDNGLRRIENLVVHLCRVKSPGEHRAETALL
jgi:hypothetical protein